MATLHCIYDPFCGWCYGAAPLVEAARKVPDLVIKLHGGGMMAGNARRQMTPDFRDFILQHVPRIEQATGKHFGEGYRTLLNDASFWFDSTPPTMAIVAAGEFGKSLDMLDRMQRAHFIDGKRITEARVLIALAEELGIPRDEFTLAFARAMEAPGTHIRDSRALLQRLGGAGFPTFAMETSGQVSILPSAQYLGDPAAWEQLLQEAATAK